MLEPEQDKSQLISQSTQAKIDLCLQKYPSHKKQSAVLSALHYVQDDNQGWLSQDLIDAVADYLGMPRIAVYEVATFYSMYELNPVGRHKICVCTNISCMLAGSDKVSAHLQQKLGINYKETTADNRFTLKEVECLGACVNAPVMQIGQHYHEHLTPEKIDHILEELK